MDRPSSQLLHAKAWGEDYELIDLQLSPLGLKAIDALNLRSGETVLDIGCGTGQTLLQIAGRVGTEGQVIGIDIPPLLLEVAAQRTKSLAQIRLVESDAQYVDLTSNSADVVFSRFGVMAFKDPVAAFSNFHRILRPSGRLGFCCWRSLQENELDHFPLEAVGVELLDETPFSLANPEYILTTLKAAGFGQINIRPYDEKVSSGDIEAMTSVLLKVGPLGKIVRETPALRATAAPLLQKALASLGDPSEVKLTAAIWIVTARAGSEAG